MLDSISISNFKVIKENLTLKNLASVNYLVGPNGCGKSSVLEGVKIIEKFDIKKLKLESELPFPFTNEPLPFPCFPNFLSNEISEDETRILKEGEFFNNMSKNEEYPSLFIFSGLTCNFNHASENKKIAISGFYDHFNDEFCLLDKQDNLFHFFEIDDKDDNLCSILKSSKNSKDEEMYLHIPLISQIINSNTVIEYITTKNVYPEFYSDYLEFIKSIFPTFIVAESSNHIVYKNLVLGDNQLSSGEKQLFILINKIFRFILDSRNMNNIILIDEPENNLHPTFQKLIPKIIKKIIELNPNSSQFQFLISTHSPFIISAAGEIGDQNVYLIKEGQCLNPQGSKKGGAKRLAMEMLGAGVEDILPKIVVICEGSTKKETKVKEKDAKVLNAIFGNNLDVVFHSNDSCDQVLQSACAVNLKTILNPSIPTENTKIIALNDFDTEKDDNLRKERGKKLRNFGVIFKVLGSENSIYKELEDFLFADGVLNLCDEKYNIKLNRVSNEGHRTDFGNHNKKIIQEILKTTESDEKILLETFQIEILAKLITLKTQVYQDLEKCIFG